MEPPPPPLLLLLLLLLLAAAPGAAGKAYTHSWDTVGDAMAMHGKYKDMERPLDADIEFVVRHYKVATGGRAITCPCTPSIGTWAQSQL